MTDPLLTLVARLGVRAVARDHGALGALVYAGFWWEYSGGVSLRSQQALAEGFGMTVKAYRAQVSALQTDGWLSVSGRGSGWKVELAVSQALLESAVAEVHVLREKVENGTFSGFSDPGLKVENGTFSGEKVEIDRFVAVPVNFPPNALSAGYVRLCVEARAALEAGTKLAKSSCSSSTATNYAVNKTDTLVSLFSAAKKPPRNAKRSKSVDGGPLPTKSADFRRVPMTAIASDPQYAVIATLHARWNECLGVQFPLNPWRYAAWRTALVEQAYTAEQLTDAMPRVLTDPWAKSNLCDPHNMFTGNASKIERFFVGNAATTHDRFGRTFPTSGSTFEF